MKINRLDLKNFMCYYGTTNTIHFFEGLNLVLGFNGHGKTKLYDAFQWLFNDGITDENNPGQLKYTSQIKKQLISEKALNQAAEGEKVVAEVLADITYLNEDYHIIRRYHATKKVNSELVVAEKSFLEVLRKNVIEYHPLSDEDARIILQRMIRPEVQPYVWFQGERGVSGIIDTSSREALKKVIEKLSDIERWDDYIAIVEKSKNTAVSQYNSEFQKINRQNSDVKVLIERRESLESEIDHYQELFNQAQSNLDQATDVLNGVIAKLPTANIVSEKKGLKAALEQQLHQLTIEYNKNVQGFASYLFTRKWLAYEGKKISSYFAEKCDVYARQANEKRHVLIGKTVRLLPAGVPERMHVKGMLENEQCFVCEREAKKGTDEYRSIQNLLEHSNKIDSITIENEVRSAWNHVESTVQSAFSSKDDIARTIEERNDKYNNIVKLKKQISDIGDAIDKLIRESGVHNHTEITNRASRASEDIQKYTSTKTKYEDVLRDKKRDLESVKQELKKKSVGSVSSAVEKKKEFFSDLYEMVVNLKKSSYTELMKQLEEKVNFHYQNINRGSQGIHGFVQFVQNERSGYMPLLVNADGSKLHNINTSQITAMKLSIVLGIMSANRNRDYTNKYPLISDAPVSDFDSEKTPSFFVEAATTFSQSIFFVKDYLAVENDGRIVVQESELKKLRNRMPDDVRINVYKLQAESTGDLLDVKNLSVKIDRYDQL
jgi:DNA sulfur modification protein DndD